MAASRKAGWRIKPEWRIWARLHNFIVVVQEGEMGAQGAYEPEGVDTEPITEASQIERNPIWLMFKKRSTTVYLELTGMTSEELEIFKRAVGEAIAAAEPIVAELDAAADGTIENNEVSMRAFRPAPPSRFLNISPVPRDLRDKASIQEAANGSAFDFR
jgi:hypothetical protein